MLYNTFANERREPAVPYPWPELRSPVPQKILNEAHRGLPANASQDDIAKRAIELFAEANKNDLLKKIPDASSEEIEANRLRIVQYVTDEYVRARADYERELQVRLRDGPMAGTDGSDERHFPWTTTLRTTRPGPQGLPTLVTRFDLRLDREILETTGMIYEELAYILVLKHIRSVGVDVPITSREEIIKANAPHCLARRQEEARIAAMTGPERRTYEKEKLEKLRQQERYASRGRPVAKDGV